MSSRHKGYAESLLHDRAAYSGRMLPGQVAVIDAELARLGWAVDATGGLVQLDEVAGGEVEPAVDATIPEVVAVEPVVEDEPKIRASAKKSEKD